MDPLSDMLVSIKNGGLSSASSIVVPYSKFKNSIAECLKKQGYIKSFSKKKRKKFPILEIELAYDGDKPRISDIKRVSKPSRRFYLGFKDIRPVKNSSGLLILSTPKGILVDKEARKELVGGEALFEIW